MTQKEIERLGFTNIVTNWNFLGIKHPIYIFSSFTIKDIVKSVYKLGIEEGIERGKSQLQDEIKDLLNI